MGKQRLTKNQKRRLKKKQLAKANKNDNNVNKQRNLHKKSNISHAMTIDETVDEYVTEEMDEEMAKNFGDIVKNKMFQITVKEETTATSGNNGDTANTDTNINATTTTTTSTTTPDTNADKINL